MSTPPPTFELWMAPGSFAEATARGITVRSGPLGGSAALVFPDALPYAERAAFLAHLAAVAVNEQARYLTLDEAAVVPAQRSLRG